MTGDVNLTHIRDALTDKGWNDDSPDECPACGRVLPDHTVGCGIGHEAWKQLAAAEAVIQAARARRDTQIDATHYHIYDPTCPCCMAQDDEWAALAALEDDR